MENSYRALNIAFIDDWTKFAYKTKIIKVNFGQPIKTNGAVTLNKLL